MSSALSRGFAIIPGDQQTLLNRDDSWAVDFGPDAYTHIPDYVLKTVEQAYMAKKAAQPPISYPPGQGDVAKQIAAVGTDPVGSCQSPCFSNSTVPICSSWPVTPKRPSDVGPSIVRETPKAVKLRLQSRLQHGSELDDVTGSSDMDDWEVSVPRAKADADAPVNRVAARPSAEATPSPDTALPCTQPSRVVAVTPDAITNSVAPAKKEGRRGRHRMIKFSSSPTKAMTGPIRMPTTKVFADESCSSHCTSSSSVTSIAPLSSTAIHLVAETNMPLPPPTPTPNRKTPSTLLRLPAPTGESERPKQSPTPCVAFLAAYPDYVTTHSGSLQNFIKACVCLSYLLEKRLLREYLFDEFVRFFSGEYLSYVARAGPGQEPLPAVEWFNLQSGAPLYTHMVLSSQNLDAVFAAYPEETSTARAVIEDDAIDERVVRSQGPHLQLSASRGLTRTISSCGGDIAKAAAVRSASPQRTQSLQSPPSPQLGSDDAPLGRGNSVPTQGSEDALVPTSPAPSGPQPLTIRQYHLTKKRRSDDVNSFRDAAKKKKGARQRTES